VIPELFESGSWNYAENGACIGNKLKLLPMRLVAWIADLYRYFRNSHAADSITTGRSAATTSRQTRWAFDGFRYKVTVLQHETRRKRNSQTGMVRLSRSALQRFRVGVVPSGQDH
jgi:hypothetical protein